MTTDDAQLSPVPWRAGEMALHARLGVAERSMLATIEAESDAAAVIRKRSCAAAASSSKTRTTDSRTRLPPPRPAEIGKVEPLVSIGGEKAYAEVSPIIRSKDLALRTVT